MKMESFSLRVDRNLSNVLAENARKQGIKVSRYMRSLIEKGLVFEACSCEGTFFTQGDQTLNPIKMKIAELGIQNLILTRKLIRNLLSENGKADELINKAETMSQDYITNLLENHDNDESE